MAQMERSLETPSGPSSSAAASSDDPPSCSESLRSDGGAWGFDDHIKACPVCSQRFTLISRRHHCRKCGGLVCDRCSSHRVQLPKLSLKGEVRVCDSCASKMLEKQRADLRSMHEESKECTRLLLELDAEANPSDLLDRFAQDPDRPELSFEAAQTRARKAWREHRESLRDWAAEKARLEQRCQSLKEKLQDLADQSQQLSARQRELEGNLEELDQVPVEISRLVRQNQELVLATAQARHILEAQEKALEAGARAQGEDLPAEREASPFLVVSTGRQDAQRPIVESRRSRTEGCRRQCQIM